MAHGLFDRVAICSSNEGIVLSRTGRGAIRETFTSRDANVA